MRSTRSPDVARALSRLRHVQETGELRELCVDHNVKLLTQFGSSISSPLASSSDSPGDIDIAYFFEGFSSGFDHLLLIDAFTVLVESDAVDYMDGSKAGDVAFYAALMGGRVLFEKEPGLFDEMRLLSRRRFHDSQWYRRTRVRSELS